MPKARTGPLSALFGINKPTGATSMSLLNSLQPLLQSSTLFAKSPEQLQSQAAGGGRRRKSKQERVKIGQGGTLDPLADGVLVVGTNNATKHLAAFLDCTKEYRAIGLLGASTDSYDSQGKVVKKVDSAHVTREKVEQALGQFRGEIDQVPPVFSALKMDGMPLYEYARKGLPLPRPIASRKQVVHKLELVDFREGSQHEYEYPTESLPESEVKELEAIQKMVDEGGTIVPKAEEGEVAQAQEERAAAAETASSARPSIFEVRMVVSSGTYVRSIVHDLGLALGSAAHVVKLTRTRQGEFTLDPVAASAVGVPSAPAPDDSAAVPSAEPLAEIAEAAPVPEAKPASPVLETFAGGCIEWSLLEKAIKELEASKKGGEGAPQRNADGWLPWEVELLARCKEI